MEDVERRPLRIRIDQITNCVDVLNKYLVRHVDDHYKWAQEPTFTDEFYALVREEFGADYTDDIAEEVREYASRMSGFLRDAFDEFKLGVELDYKNICPHCGAIHCFDFVAYESVLWSCWCKNCNKLVRASDEEERYGV